jgi:hypothetical protein
VDAGIWMVSNVFFLSSMGNLTYDTHETHFKARSSSTDLRKNAAGERKLHLILYLAVVVTG